eukprot:5371415-Amphidinium_carterae.1
MVVKVSYRGMELPIAVSSPYEHLSVAVNAAVKTVAKNIEDLLPDLPAEVWMFDIDPKYAKCRIAEEVLSENRNARDHLLRVVKANNPKNGDAVMDRE